MNERILKLVEQEWGEIKHEGIKALVRDAIRISLEEAAKEQGFKFNGKQKEAIVKRLKELGYLG